jgi:hypothetical protein
LKASAAPAASHQTGAKVFPIPTTLPPDSSHVGPEDLTRHYADKHFRGLPPHFGTIGLALPEPKTFARVKRLPFSIGLYNLFPMNLKFKVFWIASTHTFLALLAGIAVGAESPQALTLKDNKGRELKLRIISATETELVGIRSSDQKEVKIPLNVLDADSAKIVAEWKKMTGRLPTKQITKNFGNPQSEKGENDGKKFTVNFSVPEGAYNRVDDEAGIILKFDVPAPVSGSPNVTSKPSSLRAEGNMRIGIFPVSGKKIDQIAKILKGFEIDLGRALGEMTPSERAEKEPLMKVEEFSRGDFKGFRYTSSSGYSHHITVTNGDYRINIYLLHANTGTIKPEWPIELDDMPLIIDTLTITKGHGVRER